MNLEPVIESSQKDKKKYLVIIYMESRKMVLMSLFEDRNRDADIENRLVDTVGEGEFRTNLERVIEIYINTLAYVK